jgi:predicted secreted protein
VKLLLHQINKVTNKGSQTPINPPWRDEAMVDIISSCNKGMSTLVGTVNVSANLNNVNIKDCEQRKHERSTRIVETNLRRTSTRQIKIPVTRREDFYGKSLI